MVEFMETGILYVVFNKWINNPETHETPYKIGITKNSVDDRYYGLGLKMPGEFETLFAYKIKDYAEAEKSIQGIFRKFCVNGEWFKLNQKEIDLIKANCETMGGILVTDEIKNEIKNETEDENIVEIATGGIIELLPDKETFRKKLLKYHKAHYTIEYADGKIKKGIWSANNITEVSSITNNIRSGYLRNWKKNGIVKAMFEVKDT
jgi:hypothetical protein